MKERRCETCEWWEKPVASPYPYLTEDQLDGRGTCRATPVLPKRSFRDWCGEWKERP